MWYVVVLGIARDLSYNNFTGRVHELLPQCDSDVVSATEADSPARYCVLRVLLGLE